MYINDLIAARADKMAFNNVFVPKNFTTNNSHIFDVSNGSSEAENNAHREFSYRIVVGVILGHVIFFTILGNSLVVSAVVCFRRLRSVTNYFVVSLAIADLTVAVFVMPYSLLFEIYGEWRFGWVFCYFWISCDVTCCTASILHLCVISLDRYLAITGPLSYHRRMSKLRAMAMIISVWICSVAISFLPIFLGWFADHSQVQLYADTTDCGLYVNKVYAVISSATSFYIPLLVMLCVYFKIFRIAQSQAREIQRLETAVESSDPSNMRLRRKSRKFKKDFKAIRTLGTLMGVFCVSWLPFFLMYVIMPFCSSCHFPSSLVATITWLGYINSSLNPCIYTFLNRDFRIAFRKLITCNALIRMMFSEDASNMAQTNINGDTISYDERQTCLRDMSPRKLPRVNGAHNKAKSNVTFETDM